MKRKLSPFAECETGERGYVVDYAVGKVRGGADEEDSIAIDESGYARNMDLVLGGWAGYQVDFDAKIRAGFAEGSMGCFGDDPVVYQRGLFYLEFGVEGIHLWL